MTCLALLHRRIINFAMFVFAEFSNIVNRDLKIFCLCRFYARNQDQKFSERL